MFIPVSEPLFQGNEKKYLAQCIDSGWISSEGPFVRQLEKDFSKFIGVEDGCAVCNGTAALEVGLYALGVRENDEVIMPSFTIISCVLACLRLGAKPVLVDIDPQIWCMNPDLIESKITEKTKVVMPVHIYGHSVDMDKIFELKDQYGFKIFEDASEVHGGEYYSKRFGKFLKCGAMGDAASFSFYANKIVSCGEGGIVVSKDAKTIEQAKYYRNLCFGKDRFAHEDLGYNFRMTNLQAAVGVAQLEQVDNFIAIKQHCGKYYAKAFADMDELRFMPVKPWAKSVYWMFGIELNRSSNLNAATLMKELAEHQIGSRPFFKGMHTQKPLLQMGLFANEKYPCTDHAYEYGCYLPSGLNLTEEKIDYVVNAVKTIIAKYKSKKTVSFQQ